MSSFSEAVSGMGFDPLPDGWTPLSAWFVVKCLDEEGNAGWAFRTTGDINDEELLDALVVRVELLKQSIVEAFKEEAG